MSCYIVEALSCSSQQREEDRPASGRLSPHRSFIPLCAIYGRALALAAASNEKKVMPASLRRVEQLLLEGERLPFELTKVHIV